jgi:hypothetical protein
VGDANLIALADTVLGMTVRQTARRRLSDRAGPRYACETIRDLALTKETPMYQLR